MSELALRIHAIEVAISERKEAIRNLNRQADYATHEGLLPFLIDEIHRHKKAIAVNIAALEKIGAAAVMQGDE